MTADAALARLIADPLATVDLAPVALALAGDEYPELDVPGYLNRLDDLAARLTPRLGGSLENRVTELCEFLFDEEGFTGNATRYYDARNSYLNDVLDRKLGIPITLSLVAMAVGWRCGLTIHGVGLPGHFVVKAVDATGSELVFDPFHGGQPLSPTDCAQLVESVAGLHFDPTPENLAAASPVAIVQRMLMNLKAVYATGGDFVRAARVVGRLWQLNPVDVCQARDFGVLLVQANQPHRAIDPLEAYLAARPQAADAVAVRQCLKAARDRVAGWN